ncbi:MAG: tail sheath stabilizer and completion protein [Candidatus Marinimicrobia bacterium]|nr:tail sheath stabilizer and completion protein [Candidatus Neomarinimicrobiota bacterium]
MFGSANRFYHSSLRRLVIAFGSLFNDIHIERVGDDKEIRVPVTYGPKEKFLRRLQENASLDDADVSYTTPMMSFEISSISYDAGRKRNTVGKRFIRNSSDVDQLKYNFNEVPYNIDFTLGILVRHFEDGLQIIEQILPYFCPEFNVTININDINQKVDVPIMLNEVNLEEEYEGDFESRRTIIFTLTFTAKTYLYGKIRDSKHIRRTETTLWNFGEKDWTYGPTGATSAGATGALSLIEVGATGATAHMSDYNVYTNKWVSGLSGANLDNLGATS